MRSVIKNVCGLSIRMYAICCWERMLPVIDVLLPFPMPLRRDGKLGIAITIAQRLRLVGEV
jgi:hypothetical protein